MCLLTKENKKASRRESDLWGRGRVDNCDYKIKWWSKWNSPICEWNCQRKISIRKTRKAYIGARSLSVWHFLMTTHFSLKWQSSWFRQGALDSPAVWLTKEKKKMELKTCVPLILFLKTYPQEIITNSDSHLHTFLLVSSVTFIVTDMECILHDAISLHPTTWDYRNMWPYMTSHGWLGIRTQDFLISQSIL